MEPTCAEDRRRGAVLRDIVVSGVVALCPNLTLLRCKVPTTRSGAASRAGEERIRDSGWRLGCRLAEQRTSGQSSHGSRGGAGSEWGRRRPRRRQATDLVVAATGRPGSDRDRAWNTATDRDPSFPLLIRRLTCDGSRGERQEGCCCFFYQEWR